MAVLRSGRGRKGLIQRLARGGDWGHGGGAPDLSLGAKETWSNLGRVVVRRPLFRGQPIVDTKEGLAGSGEERRRPRGG